MKKVFCLGLHKTGSTSLQHFLLHNQIALARQGILFPPVTPQGLARFAGEALGRVPGKPKINEYMGHNALAYRLISEAQPSHIFPQLHTPMSDGQTALDGISQMAEALSAQAVVLCSEDLARAALVAPEIPKRFAQTLGPDDVTLFCVLRRPDQAITAWQTQRLRFGVPFGPINIAEYLGSVHLEYRAALEPWLNCFPEATLRFLPYDVVRASGGTIEVFRADSGLSLPNGLTEISNGINPGLPHALLEIARLGLGALPRSDADILRHYLAAAAPRLSLPTNEQVDLLGRENRDRLARSFEDIHHWLCQVSGRIPFFSDLGRIREIPPLTAHEAAAALLPSLLKDAKQHLTSELARDFLSKFEQVEL